MRQNYMNIEEDRKMLTTT